MAEVKKLYRSRKDRVILGVAGGLAEYFEIDPIIIRLIFVLLTIWGGVGLLLYIIGAIVIPEVPNGKKADVEEGEVIDKEKIKNDAKEFSEKTKSAAQDIAKDWKKQPPRRGAQIFGIIIIFVGLSFLFQWYIPWLSWQHIWPIILIGLGLLIIFNPRRM